MTDETITAGALLSSLEQCYTIFAHYPFPADLYSSPLRDAESIKRQLRSRPLRQLDGEELGPYASWAMTTVGDDRDYRHFLPRILELAVVTNSYHGVEPQQIANKLIYASWTKWPQSEQDAVSSLFVAAFLDCLAKHPEDSMHSAEDWLCGVAILGLPIGPLLQAWLLQPGVNATLNMTDLNRWLSRPVDEYVYWVYVAPETVDAIKQWLAQPSIQHRMRDALPLISEADFQIVSEYLADHP